MIEEGIDIPQCKLVVNYNNQINHIQQLQQRGRARQRGSRYYVISSKEELHTAAGANQMRQELTLQVIAQNLPIDSSYPEVV